jgi:hypothetical protein
MGGVESTSCLSEKNISEALTNLALDLRWSFNHSADHVWQRLDPELWELTHNPWVVLQTVSRERLQSVSADQNFRKLPRLVPHHAEAFIPLEAPYVLWHDSPSWR